MGFGFFNKDTHNYSFIELAKVVDNKVVGFGGFSRTKVEINFKKKIFVFFENGNTHRWNITNVQRDDLNDNTDFNFHVETSEGLSFEVSIYGKSKMILKELYGNTEMRHGISGALHKEHKEALQNT